VSITLQGCVSIYDFCSQYNHNVNWEDAVCHCVTPFNSSSFNSMNYAVITNCSIHELHLNNDLTRRVTNREALCGPVLHSVFEAWNYAVLWTCAQTQTVLYRLYMMTRNGTTFYQMREIQRPDGRGQIFLTCNAMQGGRARGMMPLVKNFRHIELWIAGEPGLMPLVKYFLHLEVCIMGELEASYRWQEVSRSSHETRRVGPIRLLTVVAVHSPTETE